MTDAYPPFSLADEPGYPVRLDIAYPERIANWRPLVPGMRWQLRGNAYAYWTTERYPPFTWG